LAVAVSGLDKVTRGHGARPKNIEPPLFAGKHSGGSDRYPATQGIIFLPHRCIATKIKLWAAHRRKMPQLQAIRPRLMQN
jgi:hypothetical protein